MATVQVDNTDIKQVLAEAEKGIIPDVEVSREPPKEPAKEEPKAEAKPEESDDETEGDDGLTDKQRAEWTDSMKRTIAKKHARQKSAEEFATLQYNERQLALQRAEQLARENEQLKAQVSPPKPEKVEPKREQFQTDDAYRDALIDWKVDQRLQQQRLDDLHAQEQATLEAASQRIARALELVPDFKEKTESADYIVPPQVAGLMQRSELFAELGYHFADHPEDLGRLAVLPPEKLKVEFRKIESKIQPFGSTPKVENAPAASTNGVKPSTNGSTEPSKPRAPVITPLNTGSAVQVEKDEREMTAQEALEAFQKRSGRNFSRRQRH